MVNLDMHAACGRMLPQNNLGGLGPDATGDEAIRYTGVTSVGGTPVDLVVRAANQERDDEHWSAQLPLDVADWPVRYWPCGHSSCAPQVKPLVVPPQLPDRN